MIENIFVLLFWKAHSCINDIFYTNCIEANQIVNEQLLTFNKFVTKFFTGCLLLYFKPIVSLFKQFIFLPHDKEINN